MDTRTKIISFGRAAELSRRRLVVAAGSFDILQASHTRFLQRIRSDDDTLLVVVYDDASVGKPVLSEQARAQLVAALAAVDYVLIWPQRNLDSLLDRLRPVRVEHSPDGRNIIAEVLERHSANG